MLGHKWGPEMIGSPPNLRRPVEAESNGRFCREVNAGSIAVNVATAVMDAGTPPDNLLDFHPGMRGPSL